MFDIGWDELLFTAVIAVVVIGPKDLPLALRTAGRWIGKMRRVSNHFRAGLETMIREAELEEMEKKWQEQNRKVLEQYPGAEMTAENASGEDIPSAKVAMEALPAPEASATGTTQNDVEAAPGDAEKTESGSS